MKNHHDCVEQAALEQERKDNAELSDTKSTLEKQLAEEQAELKEAAAERDRLREKLDKKKKSFGCIIS